MGVCRFCFVAVVPYYIFVAEEKQNILYYEKIKFYEVLCFADVELECLWALWAERLFVAVDDA